MTLKNVSIYQFLILSMIIIDGSITLSIIFSDVKEGLKFIRLLIIFISSLSIIMFGIYLFMKEWDNKK